MAQRKPPSLTNAIHVQGLVCMTNTGVLKCSLATGFQLLSCWFRIKSLAQEGCPFSALYEHITPDTSQHVKSQGPSSQFQIKRIPQSLAQFPSCRLDGQACGLSREGKLVLCQVGIKEIILRDIVPQRHHVLNSEHNKSKGCCTIDNSMRLLPDSKTNTETLTKCFLSLSLAVLSMARVMAPVGFSGIGSVVFEVRGRLFVAFLIPLLHSWNHLSSIGATEEGVLACQLRITPEAGISHDIDVGPKGRQADWILVVLMKSRSANVWQCPLFGSQHITCQQPEPNKCLTTEKWWKVQLNERTLSMHQQKKGTLTQSGIWMHLACVKHSYLCCTKLVRATFEVPRGSVEGCCHALGPHKVGDTVVLGGACRINSSARHVQWSNSMTRFVSSKALNTIQAHPSTSKHIQATCICLNQPQPWRQSNIRLSRSESSAGACRRQKTLNKTQPLPKKKTATGIEPGFLTHAKCQQCLFLNAALVREDGSMGCNIMFEILTCCNMPAHTWSWNASYMQKTTPVNLTGARGVVRSWNSLVPDCMPSEIGADPSLPCSK